MDEAILIEIAQRRRKLEDAIERADLNLAADHAECVRKIEAAEYDHGRNPNYMIYCERVNEPMADKLALETLREDLEDATEACRDDMNTLMEFARKVKA